MSFKDLEKGYSQGLSDISKIIEKLKKVPGIIRDFYNTNTGKIKAKWSTLKEDAKRLVTNLFS